MSSLIWDEAATQAFRHCRSTSVRMLFSRLTRKNSSGFVKWSMEERLLTSVLEPAPLLRVWT